MSSARPTLRMVTARLLRGRDPLALLARGAAAVLAVSLAGTFVRLLVQLVFARWLGEERYGIYVYPTVWVMVLSLFARMGLDTAQVRFVAAYRQQGEWSLLRGLLRRSDQLAVALSVGIAAAAGSAVWAFRDRLASEEAATFGLACLLVPLTTLLALRKGALQGFKNVVLGQLPDAVIRPGVMLLAAAALVLAARYGAVPALLAPSAPLAMALLVAASAVALAVGHRWLRQQLPAAAEGPAHAFATRSWLRVSTPLLLVSGMRQLLNQTDVLLLGALVGRLEVGIYFIAARMTQLLSFGLMAGNAIAAPLIAEAHAGGRRRELQRVVALSAWGATLFALGLAALLAAGRFFVLGAFGDRFREGGQVLLILAAGQLVNAATGPVGQLLNMTGHQDANARILAVITALNAALSYPAILAYGMEGAAWVTSAMTALNNVWTWIEVRRRLGVSSSILARFW